MILSVFKNNQFLTDCDLSKEQVLDRPGDFVEIFIGRSSDCHIILEGHQISRHHAILKFSANGWEIIKNTSFGNLFVNGEAFEKRALADKDTISIDSYLISVALNAEETISVHSATSPTSQQSDNVTAEENQDIDEDETQFIPQDDIISSSSTPESSNVESGDIENAFINNGDEASENLLDLEGAGAEDGNFESDFAVPEEDELEGDDQGFENGGSMEYSLDMDDSSFPVEVDEPEEQNQDEGNLELSQDEQSNLELENDEVNDGDGLNLDSDNSFENNEDFDQSSDFNKDSSDEQNLEESSGGFSFDSNAETGLVTGDDFGDDTDNGTQVLKGFAKIELHVFGKYAPYDRFLINEDEIVIGRDPKVCQILLEDPEVSMRHCKIVKTGPFYSLEDMQSANGTILNGLRINKAEISQGDEFLIGNTSFTVRLQSDLLQAESDRLMPIAANQSVDVEEIVEVEGVGTELNIGLPQGEASSSNALFSKDALKDPEKRTKLIRIAIGLMALLVLMVPSEDPKKANAKNQVKKENEKNVVNTKEGSKKEDKGAKSIVNKNKKKRKLNKDELEQLALDYQEAVSLAKSEKFRQALKVFDRIILMDPTYERTQDYYSQVKKMLADKEEQERKIQKKNERKKREEKVMEYLAKAEEAVKNKEVKTAEAYFDKIAQLDPENIQVNDLKFELNEYKKREQEKAVAKAEKEANRKRQLRLLKPGKSLFLQKEHYKAIIALEKFLKTSDLDNDLVKEASEMLAKARQQLAAQVEPLLGKARSLREGQDLKGAYETYKDLLKIEPTSEEALKAMNNIRDDLNVRAKRVYREALVSESLSLFDDAKEKYQEVKQIAPSDSEYFKLAEDKIKNFLN